MGIPFALTIGVAAVILLLVAIGIAWPAVGIGMLVLAVIVGAFILSLRPKDLR